MQQFGSTIAVVLAMCVAVSACTASPTQHVANKENMLSAAGFKVVPANTPARQSAMASLPPHKFVRQVRNDKVFYTYADPTICTCVYFGNQAAYGKYRQDVFARNVTTVETPDAPDTPMNTVDWATWAGPEEDPWGWYSY